jgi:hypothetical protein
MACCSFRTLDDLANSNRSLEVAAGPGTVESATCQTELEAGSRLVQRATDSVPRY